MFSLPYALPISLGLAGGGCDGGVRADGRPVARVPGGAFPLRHPCRMGGGAGVDGGGVPAGVSVGWAAVGERCSESGIAAAGVARSEEHTSELQSLMRISYAVFCLKKKRNANKKKDTNTITSIREQ